MLSQGRFEVTVKPSAVPVDEICSACFTGALFAATSSVKEPGEICNEGGAADTRLVHPVTSAAVMVPS